MPWRRGGSGRQWAGLQRRVRALVPAPVRRADLAAFRLIAAWGFADRQRLLPRLSTAANRSVLWLVIAAVLWSLGGRRGRRAALRGVLGIAATSAVTNLPAKLLTGRDRPDLGLVPEVRRLVRVPTSTSFPSGHSASAFAFATGVSLELPRVAVPLYGLATAVAASRVTTGVHYPGDVLVGAAIGTAMAFASTVKWPLPDGRPAHGPEEPASRLPAPDGAGVVIVANLDAGTRLRRRTRQILERALPGAIVQEVEAGEELDPALERAARDARVLGVAGGDGSASTAAAVARAADVPLLLVPAGTLNRLAADLGIERIDDTVRAVRHGRAIRMDLGDIDGKPFVNGVALGAYPEIVRHRERLERRIGKWPAAFLVTLRVLVRHEPVEIEIDGRAVRAWQLFVGNGRYEADGIAPSHRRHLDSRVLDVRLVSADVRWARLRVLTSVLVGRRGRCAAYEHWLTDEVCIVSRRGPLRVARDGEVDEVGDRPVIRLRAGGLVVLQPAPDDG